MISSITKSSLLIFGSVCMILLSYIYIERVNYVDYHFKHSVVKREDLPVAVHNTKQFSTSSPEQKERPKACYVVLARNSELEDWIFSMRQLEARFNNRHNYPYVFLNDEEFSTEFKDRVRNLTDAKVEFGLIPPEHWGYPDYVDPRKAAQNRIDSADMIYGSSESYRHMCRFESGFFFRHELTQKYDYYWRVEPNIQFYCDIEPDPFQYIHDNNIQYGFTITMPEYDRTIPSLWQTVKDYLNENNLMEKVINNPSHKWVTNDGMKSYNMCHFWTNFEIASFKLWRSEEYLKFFDYLDRSGGYFYERWGDAPVHSIYASLFLPPEQIHFFENIGYNHDGFIHCPYNKDSLLHCHCDPNTSYSLTKRSCTADFLKLSSQLGSQFKEFGYRLSV